MLAMKKLIALLLLSPLAFAEDIEFNLNCKITGQSIMTTENGIATEYNRVEGLIGIGDTFPVNFKYTDSPSWEESVYEILITSTESMIGIILRGEKMSEQYSYDCENQPKMCRGMRESDPVLMRKYETFNTQWHMSEDEIFSEGDNDPEINFKRYYKNDWELMISEQTGTTSYALSANCMGMSYKYDRLLRALKEQYDKK